jgi:hypothetical protein
MTLNESLSSTHERPVLPELYWLSARTMSISTSELRGNRVEGYVQEQVAFTFVFSNLTILVMKVI